MKVDGKGLTLSKSNAKRKIANPESSQIRGSFLGFLELQIDTHPELIVPADAAQLSRIGALVAGVKVG
jgi:hypothetical protein